ncbi:MAG: polysaccharide deacetylase family protein [bacterium]
MKTVVLTFDDAVKSHRTFVAPFLKELGFGATFFVTHKWMNDEENFLTWKEIGEIHEMGFEIGNHTWTHPGLSVPKAAYLLPAQLGLVEYELRRVGVPKPVSFAYTGNGFGPEAIRELQKLGYKLARRGMQPEIPYGKMQIGPTFDPKTHHPLLIPTTADAYPDWTFEHFKKVLAQSEEGKAIILQFHGVPDIAHPWVHTPPERFGEYMQYLKQEQFQVIAMRDLEKYISSANPPDDPMLEVRYPEPKDGKLILPAEMEATRANSSFWLENMLVDHRYTWDEAAQVTGWDAETVKQKAADLKIDPAAPSKNQPNNTIRVRPYPGGRHPRIGFLEGAINPMRGTKVSIFLPWDSGSYVVLDLPEAIWNDGKLLYLAHTHVPTMWDEQDIWLDNVDWVCDEDGSLSNRWELPNGVQFGASVIPDENQVNAEFWLKNGSSETLTGLRTQICIMTKAAPEMNAQTNENKRYDSPVAAAQSSTSDQWLLTAWDRCGRAWGNADCPCFHSDPVFPDCPPGETVRLSGRIWFLEGKDITAEIARAKNEFHALPGN